MALLNRIARIARRPRSIPGLLAGLGHNLANDLRARAGAYNYPHKVIFVAGLPKSGTTWVQNQLARVPGYNIRRLHDPQGALGTGDISDSVFRALPASGYSVVKTHTRHTPANFEIIRRHVPKFIVMIRDLRDMCVSRYFHVRKDPSARHHAQYNAEPQDAGMAHCIGVVGDYFVPWVADWVRAARAHPETIYLLRYETLHASPGKVFAELLAFYGIEAPQELVAGMGESRMKEGKDLGEQLQANTWLLRSTERKGEIGGWKEVFTPAHKAQFKQVAGQLLVDLGYEKDLDW